MDSIDDNLDLLQNLEFSVVKIWRANPEMSDYVALHAYESAFQLYRAELRGHTPKPTKLAGLEASVFAAVTAICEFRLGRGESPVAGLGKAPSLSLENITDALRKLSKSVERHTKRDGRQGYLTFIDKFLK
jgi:hypothetical protein